MASHQQQNQLLVRVLTFFTAVFTIVVVNRGATLKCPPFTQKQADRAVAAVAYEKGSCFSSAISQYGDIWQARPALFFMNSSTFKLSLLAVPGDEDFWNRAQTGYPWKVSPATLLFVGLVFEGASKLNVLSNAPVIDVGANMGQEVIVAGLFGHRATTFELMPQSVKAVRFNLAANCVRENLVTIVDAGVSDKPGSLNISLSGFTPQKRTEESSDANHRAQITTLDDYFIHQTPRRLTSRPMLLKLDCEGCESKALKGAESILRDFPPHFILIEYREQEPGVVEEVERLVHEFNYSRAFIVNHGDEMLTGDQIYAKEDFFRRNLKSQVWSPGDSCDCDIVFVHSNAANIGLF
mmetsp:Transcript_44370/g.94440  ORF Transcript_44370/g.94440 Transcript_44370/m.94440 type:complete len:352 (+) Transcript_44370:153-1208(+)